MKLLKPLILLATVLMAGGGLAWYWRHGIVSPSTDDAYLQANNTTIMPLVGGSVDSVQVAESQHVMVGDTLFVIEASRLLAAVDAAQAQLDMASFDAEATNSGVSMAEAELASATANLS